MAGEPRILTPEQILQELGKLFLAPASDRHVYTVCGPYTQLRPFQRRLQEETARGSFHNTHGRVEYLSVNQDLIEFIDSKGLGTKADQLAAGARDAEMRRLLSDAFRDWITSRIEQPDTVGLVVGDLEILYAYGLGNTTLPFLRQVAINGRRVCLLVPGTFRDGRLWVFDGDPESCSEFPEPQLFLNSGWVFAFVQEGRAS